MRKPKYILFVKWRHLVDGGYNVYFDKPSLKKAMRKYETEVSGGMEIEAFEITVGKPVFVHTRARGQK